MAKRRPSTEFVTPHSAAERWPRRSSLPSVFTAFVLGLQGEQTPDADLFHDAWHGLRAALASELKRRGLWQSPPRYLGICGWERWDSKAASRAESDALGELVADCYAFIFVDRLPALKRHLLEKPDIDGLVLLNVRHFLHERQKTHDPLGFRVFELLQTAVADAVAAGALHLLGGDGKIRNDTLLGFAPAAEPGPAPLDLEPVVAPWNDELLPALISPYGGQQAAAVERLRRRLPELCGQGIEAFRFRDLLDPLKRDARRRWTSLLGVSPDEGPGLGSRSAAPGPALAPPETAFESRQSFEHLTRWVADSIQSLEADPRTRAQLSTLWQYLGSRHGEGDEPGPERAGESHPSYRQLSLLLSIPRERFPFLFSLLRELVEGK